MKSSLNDGAESRKTNLFRNFFDVMKNLIFHWENEGKPRKQKNLLKVFIS